MHVSVNGHSIFFHNGGVAWEANRPAVVFLHGAGMDHTVWQQQSRALAHGHSGTGSFRVAALDLPGHGRSADVPGLEAMAPLADWLAEFLSAAGLERAGLVGHSMGAALAVECAARHPQRAAALVLVGAGMPIRVGEGLLRDTQENVPRAVDFIAAYCHGRAAHLGHAPTPGNWMMGSGTALLAACPPEVLHRDFALCAAWDGPAVAGLVRCPTLVVSGAGDRMIPPRAGKALADAIPGARFEVLPGIGHMVPTEAPRVLLKRLREFLHPGE